MEETVNGTYKIEKPVIEVDGIPYIEVPYLVRGIEDVQSACYSARGRELGYEAIGRIIEFTERTAQFFLMEDFEMNKFCVHEDDILRRLSTLEQIVSKLQEDKDA